MLPQNMEWPCTESLREGRFAKLGTFVARGRGLGLRLRGYFGTYESQTKYTPNEAIASTFGVLRVSTTVRRGYRE